MGNTDLDARAETRVKLHADRVQRQRHRRRILWSNADQRILVHPFDILAPRLAAHEGHLDNMRSITRPKSEPHRRSRSVA